MREWGLAAMVVLVMAGCAFDSAGDPIDPDTIDRSPGGDVLPPSGSPCMARDILGCYPFENDLRDASSHGNDAEVAAGDIAYTPGINGQALEVGFACEIDIVDPQNLNATSLTIDARVFLTGPLPTWRGGVIDRDNQWGMFVRDIGTFYCGFNLVQYGAASLESYQIIPQNQWTHIACTYDQKSGDVALYLNGEKVRSAHFSSAGLVTGMGESAIAGNAPDGNPMVGSLDTLRVWSKALPPKAINTLANNP